MWRKKDKSAFYIVSIVLLSVLLYSGCGIQGRTTEDVNTKYTRGVYAMGTYMTLTAYGESAESALKMSEDRIRELETLWSVTDENSDIYKVNESCGTPIEITGDTVEILRFTLDMANQTNGALNPTIFPVITAWGFISGEYHIPSENALTDLLRYTDYEKVILEENSVTLPEGMQLDLGAVGKGYTGDIISELLKGQGFIQLCWI